MWLVSLKGEKKRDSETKTHEGEHHGDNRGRDWSAAPEPSPDSFLPTTGS